MELKFARGCRAVDALTHRNERHSQRLEFINQRDEMAQIPSEPI